MIEIQNGFSYERSWCAKETSEAQPNPSRKIVNWPTGTLHLGAQCSTLFRIFDIRLAQIAPQAHKPKHLKQQSEAIVNHESRYWKNRSLGACVARRFDIQIEQSVALAAVQTWSSEKLHRPTISAALTRLEIFNEVWCSKVEMPARIPMNHQPNGARSRSS